MMYSTTENGEYSTTIPTGTDAGYYDVWYKIVSNDNDYDDTDPVNLKVEIKYLEINGCEAKEGLTYTGEEQELITLHDGVQIQLSYYYDNNSEVMCEFEEDVIPTAINAGEYNLTCYIDSNNPNIIISEYFLSLTVTISPASFTNENAPTANTGLTYTGSEQALVTPKPVVGGKVWYSTDGGTTWSETVPTATNAGDYEVWYKIVAENSNYTSTDPILLGTITIGKAASSVNPVPTAIENLTFTGSEQELVNAGTATGGTMQYRLGENGVWDTAIPKATNAGDYTVYYRAVGDSNHIDTTAQSVTVTIGHAYTKHDEVPATCITAGNIEYYTDENGKYYTKSGDTYNEITQAQTVISATDEHTYSERSPEWTWIKNGSTYDVSVKFKCAVCDEYDTTEIKPTLNVTESNGARKFTATVEYKGATYTSTRDEAVSYTITINGIEKQYRYGAYVTATAPAAPSGQYFDGWYYVKTEEKVSSSEVYTLYATRNISIEAKYKDYVVEAEPVYVMNVSERTALANGKQKVSFTFDWDLPEGYTFEKAAIIRSYVVDKPDITTANTNVHYTALKNARGTYNLNLTLGTANANKTVYVRGYIVYKDKNGISHEKYTNVLISLPVSN
ncbi:MAG: hypothetical protein VZR27_11135 [Acutalibacteraceae bacterium]|nr:hypothetical protein [Acutalibacteraceae bacterium]